MIHPANFHAIYCLFLAAYLLNASLSFAKIWIFRFVRCRWRIFLSHCCSIFPTSCTYLLDIWRYFFPGFLYNFFGSFEWSRDCREKCWFSWPVISIFRIDATRCTRSSRNSWFLVKSNTFSALEISAPKKLTITSRRWPPTSMSWGETLTRYFAKSPRNSSI